MVRFGVVGLATSAIGYIIYLLITYFGVSPILTMSLMYLIGTILSFIGNKKFVFQDIRSSRKTLLQFAFIYFLGYLINYLLLWYGTGQWGYSHQVVQGVAILIVAGFTFICLRLFVFVVRGTE